MNDTPTQDERKKFEAAMRAIYALWSFASDGCGGYHALYTDVAWKAWQARAALASSPQAPAPAPDEWLKEAMRLANSLAECDQDAATNCLGADANQQLRAVAYNALEEHLRARPTEQTPAALKALEKP